MSTIDEHFPSPDAHTMAYGRPHAVVEIDQTCGRCESRLSTPAELAFTDMHATFRMQHLTACGGASWAAMDPNWVDPK